MTQHELVMTLSSRLVAEHGKKEALKQAWQILNKLLACADPLDAVMVSDLHCCPKCLTGAWLMEEPEGHYTCYKCMKTWFAIEVD